MSLLEAQKCGNCKYTNWEMYDVLILVRWVRYSLDFILESFNVVIHYSKLHKSDRHKNTDKC
jgi:hypothetical protein